VLAEELRQGRDELLREQERLSTFRVCLFGRTKAGKSTLMEILTRGNGAARGKGAQRTTRDVRRYQWRGLEVIDVPGIGAYGGSDDTKIALDAARGADLVLFLITDDAPQPSEADHLVTVKSMGKPMLGLCNVRYAIAGDDDERRRFMSSSARWLDAPSVGESIDQFLQFARVQLPGAEIPFFRAHLDARFLAGAEPSAPWSDDLHTASRFAQFENAILDEVTVRGPYLRWRRCIDIAAVRAARLVDELLAASRTWQELAARARDAGQEINTWAERALPDLDREVTTAINQKLEELRNRIPGFVETHAEHEDIGARFDSLVRQLNLGELVPSAAARAQGRLHARLETHLERPKSLTFASTRLGADASGVSGSAIFDGARAVGWFSVVLGIVAVGVAFIPGAQPVSVAVGGLATGVKGAQGAFEDRESKAGTLRRDLEARLTRYVDRLRAPLHLAWAKEHRRLQDGVVGEAQTALHATEETLLLLSRSAFELAWRVEAASAPAQRTLVERALVTAGVRSPAIRRVARAPGATTLLELEPGTTVDPHAVDALRRVLGEEVDAWVGLPSTAESLSRALPDIKFDAVHERGAIRRARVSPGSEPPTGTARLHCTARLLQTRIDGVLQERGGG